MTYLPHVPGEIRSMLDAVGVREISELFDCIPPDIRLTRELRLPPALSEPELTAHLEELASKTRTGVLSFLGAGCYDHFIPAVVDAVASRAEFLTAYTPYQAEASQGSLQAFFEYQTLICRLTGCEVSNASMYDGASAAAEAVLMGVSINGRNRVAIDEGLHPEYRSVIETYVRHLDMELRTVRHAKGCVDGASLQEALSGEVGTPGGPKGNEGDPKPDELGLGTPRLGSLVVQSPDFFGTVHDLKSLADAAHAAGALLVAVVDPVSLGLLKRPGELGADIVVGEGQSLGNARCFGGPGFGFLATRLEHVRRMPGRLVGEAKDRHGRRGYVLTLQAREQHIRRGRATSNICTNHALAAIRAAVYLSVMGPHGLRRVAELCLAKAHYAADRLARLPGVSLRFQGAPFFKEFAIDVQGLSAAELRARLLTRDIDPGLDLGRFDPSLAKSLLVAVTERRTRQEIDRLVEAVRREVGP